MPFPFRAPVFLVMIGLLAPGAEGAAQRRLAGPDSVAEEFQSALRAVFWRGALSRLHPEALEAFHLRISILVESDTTRIPARTLYPDGGLAAFRATSREAVFLRVFEVLSQDAPGLVHALVVRDVEVIGHVPEGPDLAHVVYRSTADLSGAEPELRMMTMKRDGQRWGVKESQELDILFEAFRGISRKRSVPPGGWPGGIVPDTASPRISARPEPTMDRQERSRWQSVQVSPWSARKPSSPMMGTMAKPATGSAHHHPSTAFSPSPTSRMAER